MYEPCLCWDSATSSPRATRPATRRSLRLRRSLDEYLLPPFVPGTTSRAEARRRAPPAPRPHRSRDRLPSGRERDQRHVGSGYVRAHARHDARSRCVLRQRSQRCRDHLRWVLRVPVDGIQRAEDLRQAHAVAVIPRRANAHKCPVKSCSGSPMRAAGGATARVHSGPVKSRPRRS
jgi:hypothetical protein